MLKEKLKKKSIKERTEKKYQFNQLNSQPVSSDRDNFIKNKLK
jgi:hypothetical protein